MKLILYLECGDRTRWDTEADGHPPPPSVDWVLDRCPACGEEDVLVVDTGPLTTRDVAEALGVSLRRAQALAKSRQVVGAKQPDANPDAPASGHGRTGQHGTARASLALWAATRGGSG